MSGTKWIPDLTADIPVGTAARRVLTARLAGLRRALKRLDRRKADEASVHDLRVATRRATAAVHNFSACLPSREQRRALRRLKQLRHKAGAVRDCDVLLLELKQTSDSERPGACLLYGYLLAQRERAHRRLRQACDRYQRSTCQRLRDCVDSVRQPEHGPQTAGELGPHLLAELGAPLWTGLQKPVHDPSGYHVIRLALKPLRYTLENFAQSLESPLIETAYQTLSALQEQLGAIQDAVVAIQTVEAMQSRANESQPPDWSVRTAELTALQEAQQQAMANRCAQFELWRQPARINELHEACQELLSVRQP